MPYRQFTDKRKLLGSSQAYYKEYLNAFGSSMVAFWPMWDEAASAAAVDLVAGRNATATNVAFGAAGFDRKKSISLPGNGGLAIEPAATAALNLDQGTFLAWVKLPAAAWTDATLRYLFEFYIDANNYFFLEKNSISNDLYCVHRASSISQAADMLQINYTGWFLLACTWSKPALNNRIRILANGTKVVEKAGSLGNFAGSTLSATRTLLGLDVTGGTGGWSGNVQYAALLNVETTPAKLRALADAGPLTFDYISIIGDSISAITGNWTYNIPNALHAGNNIILNHAVSSQSIEVHLATQAAACASDDATAIIMQMGTNDNNAGDMNMIQNTVKTAIDTLRASNPRAGLYYMNILPKWTAPDGVTPVAADNTRAAIAAGCAARNVPCWDTYTVPWINAADTSDGTHPNATGATKIANQVLARL